MDVIVADGDGVRVYVGGGVSVSVGDGAKVTSGAEVGDTFDVTCVVAEAQAASKLVISTIRMK